MTATTTTGATAATATTGASASVKNQLLSCLKAANFQVVSSGKTSATKGAGHRVPIDTPVPADYLGVVVFPHGSFVDLWLASDRTNAVKTKKALNDALSKEIGSTAVAAFAVGAVVFAAPANFGQASFSDSDAFDRCTKKLKG
jgi:hypothetical protein